MASLNGLENQNDDILIDEEAVENATEYAHLDSALFGAEFVAPALDDDETEYLVEDFHEVNDLFQAGASGACKCPAPLLILLWQERKRLKRRLRQEGLWKDVDK